MNARSIVADLSSDHTALDPSDRLAVLFDTHADRLYRLARRLTANADDARDLVQDTFLRATRVSPPRGTRAEEAWLVRVMVNIQRDAWRKTAVRRAYAASLQSSESTDRESALLARITIWRALEQLPPRRRAVLVMHELEGLSVVAIASLLGITRITVRWHLSTGRRELAQVVKRQEDRRS